jgi:O-antigen/teichoic acid export membrane protein
VSAVTGTLWMVLGNLLTRGVGFAGQVALGWLLVPEEFGVWALAVSIATAVAALRSGGTSQILIKRGSEYAVHVGMILRFALAFDALAMLTLLLVAALMWAQHLTLAIVLCGIALSIPLGTPAMILKARLTIDRRFRELATLTCGSSLVWQASVVALALLGFGAFSFTAPAFMQAAFESFTSWRYAGKLPTLRTQASAHDYWLLFRESRWVMLSAAALALATTGGYFAVAMLSDARTTGLYFFAFQLIVAVSAPVYGAFETVLPTLLTRLDADRPRQTDACVRTLRVSMGVGVPAAAVFALAAPMAIHLVWQGAWDAAAPAVQVLAACLPAWLLVSAGRSLIDARGLWRVRFVVLGVYGVGSTLAAAIGTLLGGVHVIAIAVATFHVGFALAFVLVLARLGIPSRRTGALILLPLALTAVAYLIARTVTGALMPNANPLPYAVVMLVAFLASVALGNLLFMRTVWQEVRATLLRRPRGAEN